MRSSVAPVLILFSIALSLPARAFQPPPFLPNVVDQAEILSVEDKDAINAGIGRLREVRNIWAAVLIVPDVSGASIEDVANQTFTAWALGERGRDNGLLFVFSIGDRRARIAVGRGLEGDITDLRSRRLLDETILPRFKAQGYRAGILAGLKALEDQSIDLARAAPAERSGVAAVLLAGVVVLAGGLLWAHRRFRSQLLQLLQLLATVSAFGGAFLLPLLPKAGFPRALLALGPSLAFAIATVALLLYGTKKPFVELPPVDRLPEGLRAQIKALALRARFEAWGSLLLMPALYSILAFWAIGIHDEDRSPDLIALFSIGSLCFYFVPLKLTGIALDLCNQRLDLARSRLRIQFPNADLLIGSASPRLNYNRYLEGGGGGSSSSGDSSSGSSSDWSSSSSEPSSSSSSGGGSTAGGGASSGW